MILLVGLGNPDNIYINTRHNVGFRTLDKLVEKKKTITWESSKKLQALICKNEDILLAKPQGYMNNSGSSVERVSRQFKIKSPNIWVVHDDLDLKLGEYKIQFGKGPKIHNGVNSIITSLGTDEFWRVRIGVDNRESDNRIPGEAYVLQDFTPEEEKTISAVIEMVLNDLGKQLAEYK